MDTLKNMNDSTQEPNKADRKKKLNVRYSVRTLLIFASLSGSGFGLWWNWDPWIQIAQQHTENGTIEHIKYIKDQDAFIVQSLGNPLMINSGELSDDMSFNYFDSRELSDDISFNYFKTPP